MASTDEHMLIEALEPLARENGLELVTVELVGPKKAPTIRIYLDADGGITFDQIVGAHPWIDTYMEENDPFPGAYTLEISSPGIDRPLRTLEHFKRSSGETVVLTISGEKNRRTGKLEGVSEVEEVLLTVDGAVERIPYRSIKKAHVKGQIDFNARKEL